MAGTGLAMYPLSNKAQCFFFTKGEHSNLDVHFAGVDGKQTYRSVVGYATQADGTRRYWHFGIQGRPSFAPSFAYLLSAHVIFTSDGATPWPSHKKMHSARRRQCKTWFNPEWRDRLLATIHWLSQGNPTLRLPAAKGASIEVSLVPEEFESEVSYADPPTRKQRLLLAEFERPAELIEEDEEVESDEEDVSIDEEEQP